MDMDQMDSTPMGNRRQDGFPTADPLQALEQDHRMVRLLFERMLNSQDMQVKQQCGPQILMALEMHSRLEESCFYPQVEQIDPQLISHCQQEHEETDRLVEQLKGMDMSDPNCDRMFRQLCDSVMHHIGEEENKLFPQIRSANIDMESLGIQMAAFEANMSSEMARSGNQSSSGRGLNR